MEMDRSMDTWIHRGRDRETQRERAQSLKHLSVALWAGWPCQPGVATTHLAYGFLSLKLPPQPCEILLEKMCLICSTFLCLSISFCRVEKSQCCLCVKPQGTCSGTSTKLRTLQRHKHVGSKVHAAVDILRQPTLQRHQHPDQHASSNTAERHLAAARCRGTSTKLQSASCHKHLAAVPCSCTSTKTHAAIDILQRHPAPAPKLQSEHAKLFLYFK